MLSFYATIAKVDRERRVVVGYASTEALDQQGEIVRLEALEAALPDYMRFANIREMHQPSAVGVAEEAQVDAKGLWLSARVVDERAWEKVTHGVYKGFSIGGRVTARDPADRRIVTGVDLTEISLVDRPANPEAVFAVAKRAGGALRLQPHGTWDCGTAGHRHAAKAEATTCMERQMSVHRGNIVEKRSYSDTERARLAAAGAALPDGSFPIRDRADLADAIHAWARAKDPARAKAHIIARAHALGATDLLPEAWRAGADAPPQAIAKGLHVVACLATLLDEIDWLQQNAAAEEIAGGGDAGECAPRLAAWLADGAELLRDCVVAATATLIDGGDVAPLGDAVDTLAVEKAAAARGWPLALAAALRRAGGAAGLAAELEKRGARNSRADLARIQKIHDQAVALGAACGPAAETATGASVTKRADDPDAALGALAKIAARVDPLIGAVDELKKRLAVVEAMPLPPRAVLGAIALSKEDDHGGVERASLQTRLALLPAGAARAGEILRQAYYRPPR